MRENFYNFIKEAVTEIEDTRASALAAKKILRDKLDSFEGSSLEKSKLEKVVRRVSRKVSINTILEALRGIIDNE